MKWTPCETCAQWSLGCEECSGNEGAWRCPDCGFSVHFHIDTRPVECSVCRDPVPTPTDKLLRQDGQPEIFGGEE